MAKTENIQRSPSASSRDSDGSRDRSGHRREDRGISQRGYDRTGRRGRDQAASPKRSKSRSSFEERSQDVQRQSRIDHPSKREAWGTKSKQKRESRWRDHAERDDDYRRRDLSERATDSKVAKKLRKGESRSRSRDRLELDDSFCEKSPRRRASPKRTVESGVNTKHRKEGSRNRSRGHSELNDSSQDDRQVRPGDKRASTHADSPDSGDHDEEVRKGRKKLKSNETSLRRAEKLKEDDSDVTHHEISGSSCRNEASEKEDHFEDIHLSSFPKMEKTRSRGEVNGGFVNTEVNLRPTDDGRAPRDQRKRNGMINSDDKPEELTYRARELNNVPDPRSTLCQRTDMMLGVMDTRRDLSQTDDFVFENPKGRRILTHIAAVLSVLEALLGLGCGTFLLVDAGNQNIKENEVYMVYAYMALHGLALVSGLLLVWANKKCQLDLIIAWIAVQISTGIVFIGGTIVCLIIELLPSDADFGKIIIGAAFIYFSSAYLIFIVLKVLTVAVVIQRYKKLTWIPEPKAPQIRRPVSRWSEYRPPPHESGTTSAAEPSVQKAEAEVGAPTIHELVSSRTPQPETERPARSKVAPPPPVRMDSIQDRTLQSTSSSTTVSPEPVRMTIPRLIVAVTNEERPLSSSARDLSIPPRPDPIRFRRGTRYASHEELSPKPRTHVSRLDALDLELESSSARRVPSYARPEASYVNGERPYRGEQQSYREDYPSHRRDIPSYRREESIHRRGEPPHEWAEQSYRRDRSPHGREELSYTGEERSYRGEDQSYRRSETSQARGDQRYSREVSPRTRSTPIYARPLPPRVGSSYIDPDPTLTRECCQYSRPDSTYQRPEDPSLRRDPVYRSVPAERHTDATRSRVQLHLRPDPAHVAVWPKYLPTGAVPAVGSPEAWERSHHRHSYGMPQTRHDEVLRGSAALREYEHESDPEPDYS